MEPVMVTIGSSGDSVEVMMDIETIDAEDVLSAVTELRGVAMDVDEAPWDETSYVGPSEDIVAVLGETQGQN